MLTVLWIEPMPAPVRATFGPVLTQYLHLIPGWCYELRVRWDDSDTESALYARVNHEYRACTLSVCPGFLARQPSQQIDDVVHELVHIAVEPLRDLCFDFLRELKGKQEGLEEWGKELIRQRTEGVVCDVTHLLLTRQSVQQAVVVDGPVGGVLTTRLDLRNCAVTMGSLNDMMRRPSDGASVMDGSGRAT